MNNIEELSPLMVELLDSNISATPEKIEITDRGSQIIDEISDFAEQTRIFQENKGRGAMLDGLTALQLYRYMLNRVINAPTDMHANGSVLLIMPFLRQKLRRENKNDRSGSLGTGI